MILLDTNVLSALMSVVPDRAVAVWLDRQPRQSVWTTSITVFEIEFGIALLPPGKRRGLMQLAFTRVVDDLIQRRLAVFDTKAAYEAAQLAAERRIRGQSGQLSDTMIAGIAVAQRATLATRNIRHFDDLPTPVVSPWNPR